MIQIKPQLVIKQQCPECHKEQSEPKNIIYQGPHICTESYCSACKGTFLQNLTIGQGILETLIIRKSDNYIYGRSSDIAWFSKPIKNIYSNPRKDIIKFEVIKRNPTKGKVIILNTLDNCYGHSLLHFLNLQNIIDQKQEFCVIVIIQPFLRWLLPKEGIDEVWIAHVSFGMMKEYYEDLNNKIQNELQRFGIVYLSHAHLCPKNVAIEKFSKIKPFNFDHPVSKPRVSFVWREDVNRLWVKSYWIYGALRKFGIAGILQSLHYLRVLIFMFFLHKKLKGKYQLTLVGLGKMGWFPDFVADERVEKFDDQSEIHTTQMYSQSELVIGVHGSSMILPSAHAGMTISIMPLKRWGNFAEDILFSEEDNRLASFQKRIIPMNTSILETLDICENMLKGRAYFVKKFIYDNSIL